MKRLLGILGAGIFLSLISFSAQAQQSNIYWQTGSGFSGWQPLSAANPMPVSATFTPSGTQNVNISQVLGAAPSLTNPLWVIPATGASFAVTGTFFQATQPVSGTVQIGNTPNTTPILVQQSFTPTEIATSTTTTVKSGAGVLHGITINTKGTVASTITIYDNTAASGTKIAIIDSLNLSGSFFYDAGFSTGLTVVTTGTLAPDITVLWR